MQEWLLAFAMTQIVEAPIYYRALRVPAWQALGASAITHPVVWFVFPRVTHALGGYWSMVAVAELFAWLVEAAWFAMASRKTVTLARALTWSFVANASSVAVGLLSRHFFGAP